MAPRSKGEWPPSADRWSITCGCDNRQTCAQRPGPARDLSGVLVCRRRCARRMLIERFTGARYPCRDAAGRSGARTSVRSIDCPSRRLRRPGGLLPRAAGERSSCGGVHDRLPTSRAGFLGRRVWRRGSLLGLLRWRGHRSRIHAPRATRRRGPAGVDAHLRERRRPQLGGRRGGNLRHPSLPVPNQMRVEG